MTLGQFWEKYCQREFQQLSIAFYKSFLAIIVFFLPDLKPGGLHFSQNIGFFLKFDFLPWRYWPRVTKIAHDKNLYPAYLPQKIGDSSFHRNWVGGGGADSAPPPSSARNYGPHSRARVKATTVTHTMKCNLHRLNKENGQIEMRYTYYITTTLAFNICSLLHLSRYQCYKEPM